MRGNYTERLNYSVNETRRQPKSYRSRFTCRNRSIPVCIEYRLFQQHCRIEVTLRKFMNNLNHLFSPMIS